MSTQALASQTFGLYSGLVYCTPIVGGIIADRWLGAKKTVVIGVCLMTLGHFAMVFEQSFLLALLILVLGSGCLKGNITAQVGHLYHPDDESKRTRGFTIFSTGINIGSVAGPIVCGSIAQMYGWHYGFGLAGILMFLACVIYLIGQKYLPKENVRKTQTCDKAIAQPEHGQVVILLIVIMLTQIFTLIVFMQTMNVGLVWAVDYVDLSTPFGNMPVPWFISINTLFSILVVPLLFVLWRWQEAKGREPSEIVKIGVGSTLMLGSMLLFALSSHLAGDAKDDLFLPILAHVLAGLAFMWFWPMLLAIVSRSAPKNINAMMIGCCYLVVLIGGVGAGYIGRFYNNMTATEFWLLNSSIAATSVVILLLFGPALNRALDRGQKQNYAEELTGSAYDQKILPF